MEKSKKRDEKSGGEGKEEVKEEEACVYMCGYGLAVVKGQPIPPHSVNILSQTV